MSQKEGPRRLIVKSPLTLLLGHSPHHDVHTGSIGLATQLQRAKLTLKVLHVVQDPLKLRLATAELLQHKVMNLLHIVGLQLWETQYGNNIV